MHRDEIIRRIEQYFGAELLLKARQVDQFLANGIQVQGKEDVQTIVVGVSATQELFQQAKQEHADMILCKHPLRIDVPFQVLDPSLETRLRTIFTENWTVGGYHYVLDVHPEVGNAPLLLKKLGANITGSFYDDWGFTARLPQPQLLSALQEKLQNIVHHPVFMVAPPGVESVQTLGLVTG